MESTKANPLSFEQFFTGTSMTLAENTSMPLADVNISISAVKQASSPGVAPTFDYEIVMNSEFMIESTTDQNCSIAFAYPGSWGYGRTTVVCPEFDIQFESVSTPYVEFDGSDFDYETLPSNVIENLEFLSQVRLAIINVTLEANTTHTLNVHCRMEFSFIENLLRFSYCVGSARAWAGSTLETVRMEVVDEEVFYDVTFHPDEFLVVQNDTDRITGFWSLNIPGFGEDYVSCDLWQSQWPYGDTRYLPPSDDDYTTLVLGAISVVLITVIISFCITRRKMTS